MSRFRGRISSAHLIALVALFVSLGGTSFAALTITGKNIKNGSLSGADVKNNSLTGADIKNLKGGDVTNNSLTGADVKNLKGGDITNGTIQDADIAADALTGRVIKESSLGKVPSAANADHATSADTATNATNATNATSATNATHATSATTATTAANATTVDGATVSGLNYTGSNTSGTTTVLNVEGLQVKATCPAGDLTLNATSTTAGADLTANANELATTNEVDTIRQNWAANTNAPLIGSGDYQVNLSYRVLTGTNILNRRTHTVTAQFAAIDDGTNCRVFGHATSTNTGLTLTKAAKK